MQATSRPTRAAVGALLLAIAYGALGACAWRFEGGDAGDERPGAVFAEVARVLRHPRCLNCHTVTDHPTVGDERRRHAMNVVRGADDGGAPGQRCSTCHQERNQPLVGVPGAPHWKMAPLSMGWEGLDDRALQAALLDPARNGGRSPEQLLHHVAQDPLVGWAWDPGPGRTPPPVSRAEFVASVRTWLREVGR